MSTPFLTAVDRLSREAQQIEHETSVVFRSIGQELDRVDTRITEIENDFSSSFRHHVQGLMACFDKFIESLVELRTEQLDIRAKLYNQADIRRAPVTFFEERTPIEAQPEQPPAQLPPTPDFSPERKVEGESSLAAVFKGGRRGQRQVTQQF